VVGIIILFLLNKLIVRDAKVTLCFNAPMIEQAKAYAATQGLNLSRLTEILLRKVMDTDQQNQIEHILLEDWVCVVTEEGSEDFY